MNELLECPKCHLHKWFLKESNVLTSMPPIYIEIYTCSHCGFEVITERKDRHRKADFVKINEGVSIFFEGAEK